MTKKLTQEEKARRKKDREFAKTLTDAVCMELYFKRYKKIHKNEDVRMWSYRMGFLDALSAVNRRKKY